jgi:hypothetical protein
VAEKRIDLRIAWAVFSGIVTRIERDIGTSIDCNSAGICRDIDRMLSVCLILLRHRVMPLAYPAPLKSAAVSEP